MISRCRRLGGTLSPAVGNTCRPGPRDSSGQEVPLPCPTRPTRPGWELWAHVRPGWFCHHRPWSRGLMKLLLPRSETRFLPGPDGAEPPAATASGWTPREADPAPAEGAWASVLGADTGASGPAPGNLTGAKPKPHRADNAPAWAASPAEAPAHRPAARGRLPSPRRPRTRGLTRTPLYKNRSETSRPISTCTCICTSNAGAVLEASLPLLPVCVGRDAWGLEAWPFPSLSASVPSMSHSGGICISCQESPAQQTT